MTLVGRQITQHTTNRTADNRTVGTLHEAFYAMGMKDLPPPAAGVWISLSRLGRFRRQFDGSFPGELTLA
jgi:hypothetical protein